MTTGQHDEDGDLDQQRPPRRREPMTPAEAAEFSRYVEDLGAHLAALREAEQARAG